MSADLDWNPPKGKGGKEPMHPSPPAAEGSHAQHAR